MASAGFWPPSLSAEGFCTLLPERLCFIAQQLPKCTDIGKKGDKGALINREELGEKKLIKI